MAPRLNELPVTTAAGELRFDICDEAIGIARHVAEFGRWHARCVKEQSEDLACLEEFVAASVKEGLIQVWQLAQSREGKGFRHR